MILVCIVAVICSASLDADKKVECTIVKSECISVSEDRATSMNKMCDTSPNCVETSPNIFVMRQAKETKVESSAKAR